MSLPPPEEVSILLSQELSHLQPLDKIALVLTALLLPMEQFSDSEESEEMAILVSLWRQLSPVRESSFILSILPGTNPTPPGTVGADFLGSPTTDQPFFLTLLGVCGILMTGVQAPL